MIQFRLSELESPLVARLLGADVAFSSVSTDSRTLLPGDLFVALQGPRCDGHDHLAQAEQRGITPEEVVTDVMMGKSRIKEMMSPIEVGNLFVFGFSRFARYLIGGDMLFDGGMVLTY